MIEILTGGLLASAAGLNAYVPLLALGLLARFTSVVALPSGWDWLGNNWALGLLAVLFVVEVIVDKVPALDTVNDVLQTVVRPASGGMVFSAGVGSDTVAVDNPEAFTDFSSIMPFIVGIGIALVPHILKTVIRPIVNTMTGGLSAPLLSAAEDAGAIGLTLLAVIAPVIGIICVILLFWMMFRFIKKARSPKRDRA